MMSIRLLIKSALENLPIPIKRNVVRVRDWWWWRYCQFWELQHANRSISVSIIPTTKTRSRILFYAIYGMRHAGTEKNLQLMANSLCEEYEVFYMFGVEPGYESRTNVLSKEIQLIPFTYSHTETKVPHLILDMLPRLTQVVNSYKIDCLVTASPGYAHYPWSLIRDIPIVLLNIFGAPTLQPNIKAIIYNSLTTRNHAGKWLGEDKRAYVKYAPLLSLPPDNLRELGNSLRNRLAILPEAFVFGRIGRADDGIFDPIGIRAWQKILQNYPKAYFLIMSPPPALEKIVSDEKIPRVIFLPPSSSEVDVWAFHGALDAMAHFRFDGETSGVAIAESLFAGNPLISHKSHIWNAHCEYLKNGFSLVVEKDDPKAYAEAMSTFISIRNNNPETWKEKQKQARITAEKNFSPDDYTVMTKNIIRDILARSHV